MVEIQRVEQPRRNVELKARVEDLGRCRELCAGLGAVLCQRDTYFRVAHGRLKLREQAGATAQLIACQRPDFDRPRESRYRIIEVDDGTVLGAALAEVLGVLAVVRKKRSLFFWKNVRIHLD